MKDADVGQDEGELQRQHTDAEQQRARRDRVAETIA